MVSINEELKSELRAEGKEDKPIVKKTIVHKPVFHKPVFKKPEVKHAIKHTAPAVHPAIKKPEEKPAAKHIEKHPALIVNHTIKKHAHKFIARHAVKKPVITKITKSPSPTLNIASERDIAMDFAMKVYRKFGKLIKSTVLFGSSVKDNATPTSDVDIIIVIDDSSVKWDQELIVWYREELGKIIRANPYKKELHINTVKLTTWWQDLVKGDPVIVNILRYGEPLIDAGGFFDPLKLLLQEGKISSTPEAVYTCLQRAPQHLARSRISELGSIEGIYWAFVDSSHALLMTIKLSPPSPEHVPIMLKESFVDKKRLNMKYVLWYRDLYLLHRKIVHGELTDIKGEEIDLWQARADEYIKTAAQLIEKIIEETKK